MLREIEIPKNDEQEPLENAGSVSGFISPAEDYKDRRLHIAQRIVSDPTNTFYFEAINDEMKEHGITEGTIIIVDRSKEIMNGSLIICNVEGEWLNRFIVRKNKQIFLYASKQKPPIEITGRDIEIFGAVTWHCVPQKSKYVRPSRL
ncbi:DNA polymerase V [Pedobacter sp. UYP30]|uniref:LexA family protein n=1 Tax=Pedobacter sp. UYP30 TaxID=1756400 RepID=UPI0033948084